MQKCACNDGLQIHDGNERDIVSDADILEADPINTKDGVER